MLSARPYYTLISSKNISGVDLWGDVVEGRVVAVGNDGVALILEASKVVHDLRAEEHCAIFEGWFVDDNLCTFSLDALHHALHGALAEVVRVALHREAVDADNALALAGLVVVAIRTIRVVASLG